MNLTAVTDANEVRTRHVEDSLAIIPPIHNSYSSHCNSASSSDSLSLVDVGSGAGLPGLIFAIACPGHCTTSNLTIEIEYLNDLYHIICFVWDEM